MKIHIQSIVPFISIIKDNLQYITEIKKEYEFLKTNSRHTIIKPIAFKW
jgi:hypothetical protein